jgi:hypothetical protein
MSRHWDRNRERRRERRAGGAGMRARVRPGYQLTVLDMSASGTLVELTRPLRPGSQVDVQLETGLRRGTVSARVVRCAVAAIDSESGITYRAALSFMETCEWVREALTPIEYGVPASLAGRVTSAAAAGDQLPRLRDEPSGATVGGPK